jgi:hypothetical protein
MRAIHQVSYKDNAAEYNQKHVLRSEILHYASTSSRISLILPLAAWWTERRGRLKGAGAATGP